MYASYQEFQSDSLLAAMTVESIMAQRPWMLYDKDRNLVPADEKFLGTALAHQILKDNLEKYIAEQKISINFISYFSIKK